MLLSTTNGDNVHYRTATESTGCVVAYVPDHASLEDGIEIGTIKGFSETTIYVEFKGREQAQVSCSAKDLVFYDRPLRSQIIQNAFTS